MRGLRRHMTALLCLVLMCSANTLSPLEQGPQVGFVEDNDDPVRNEILASVPIWVVGDQWTYTVMLDAIKKSMFPDLDKRTSMPASIPRDPTKDAEEAEQTRNFWDHGW